jgi:hypothetical protein
MSLEMKSGLENKIKQHFCDATATSSALNPVYAVIETTLMGFSPKVSFNAKLTGTAINYLGLASVYSRTRDRVKKYFNIEESTPGWKKSAFDSLYGFGFTMAVSSPIYMVSGLMCGEADIKKSIAASGISCLMNIPLGVVNGYAIDCFRDLTGMKESNRIPRCIGKLPKAMKKGIASVLVGSSIAATYVYLRCMGL